METHPHRIRGGRVSLSLSGASLSPARCVSENGRQAQRPLARHRRRRRPLRRATLLGIRPRRRVLLRRASASNRRQRFSRPVRRGCVTTLWQRRPAPLTLSNAAANRPSPPPAAATLPPPSDPLRSTPVLPPASLFRTFALCKPYPTLRITPLALSHRSSRTRLVRIVVHARVHACVHALCALNLRVPIYKRMCT